MDTAVRKSKSQIMLESEREKLCYDLCRACRKERVLRHYKSEPDYFDKEFGQEFISEWDRERVQCPAVNNWVSVWEEPPEECPLGIFRHAVGIAYYRR